MQKSQKSSMSQSSGMTEKLSAVPEALGLPETNTWGRFKRWLGIYSQQEKEILAYAKHIEAEAILVATGQKQITSRPGWMRKAEYDRLRTLSTQVERKGKRKRSRSNKIKPSPELTND